MLTNKNQKAVKAGRRDFKNGVPYQNNPMQHGPNVHLSAWWQVGWKEAEKDKIEG